MLSGSCHCSICRAGATDSYSWGRKALKFVRYRKCGCVTHWQRIRPRQQNYMGVNARNLDPAALEGVRIRLLDGADTWKYLD